MVDTNILVLGATGSVGRETGAKLVRQGAGVIVASRSQQRADALAASIGAVDAVAIDVTRSRWRIPDNVGIVIDCTGHDRVEIATRAAESGCTHIDVSASADHVERTFRLHARIAATGHSVIVGAGLAPGISTMMAHRLLTDGTVNGLRVDLVVDLFDPHGSRAMSFITSLAGSSFTDPITNRRIANFSDPSSRLLPAGFGTVTTARVGFSDATIFAERLGRSVDVRLGFTQPGVTKLLGHLRRRHVRTLAPLAEAGARLAVHRPRAWVCAASDGHRCIWATGVGQASATAAHVGLLVHRLHTRDLRPGVLPAHDIAPLDDASCDKLRSSGIAIAID